MFENNTVLFISFCYNILLHFLCYSNLQDAHLVEEALVRSWKIVTCAVRSESQDLSNVRQVDVNGLGMWLVILNELCVLNRVTWLLRLPRLPGTAVACGSGRRP